MIPLPECTPVPGPRIRFVDSPVSEGQWQSFFSTNAPINLPSGTAHRLELEFVCHSTAFIRVIAKRIQASASNSWMKITYSEAYEGMERKGGHLASKTVRDQREGNCLRGPHDEYTFGGGELQQSQMGQEQREIYEPFWWRTFRFLALEIEVGEIGGNGLTLLGFEATQTNYPLNMKAQWELGDGEVGEESKNLWDISIRTLRNCAFDGYSDCPFYEQLQLVNLIVFRARAVIDAARRDTVFQVLSRYSLKLIVPLLHLRRRSARETSNSRLCILHASGRTHPSALSGSIQPSHYRILAVLGTPNMRQSAVLW